MGSALRPFLAGCALTALVVGAAWWLHGGGAPATTSGDATRPPAPPADTTADIGAVAVPQPALRPVVVRVLDAEDESALAGATVRIRVGGDEAPSVDTMSAADAEGRVRFELPAADEPFELMVRAADHVRAWISEDEEPTEGPEIVLHLGRAGRVRGVVRGPDGQPVDGVAVRAEIDGHAEWPDDESVVTARGGVYEIDAIEVGAEFSVVVADAGRLASRHGLVVTTAGEVVTADLTLSAAATLRVRVLWPDGLPVVGASVEVQPSGETAETDDSGRAEFGALPAGRHHVLVCRDGFADAEVNAELAPGETRTVDVRPAPNAVLAGIVVDDAGFPVGGAAISVDAGGDVRGTTLSDGTFRIACRDEDPHDLVVTREGHCETTVPTVTAPDEDLRIVLPRRPRIRCRLVPPEGVAAPRVVVAWWDGAITPAAIEDGVLSVQVAPGPGRVSFQAKGFIVVERDVEATAGAVVDWGDVPLAPSPRLKGRVVDEKGRPVEAFVYAKVGRAQVPLTSTGDDGGFEFDGLPAGVAELRVEATGFVRRTVHCAFAPGMRPEVVVLTRGGAVKGRVVDAAGKPEPRATYVSFADAAAPGDKDRHAFPTIQADGTFEVNLLPGRYRARATFDDAEGAAEVEVVAGEAREVTITLR